MGGERGKTPDTFCKGQLAGFAGGLICNLRYVQDVRVKGNSYNPSLRKDVVDLYCQDWAGWQRNRFGA